MNKITKEQFDEFVRGYITAALWSTIDVSNEDEHLDARYDASDLSPDALKTMVGVCQAFVDANEDDLLEYAKEREYVRHRGEGTAWDYAGHDLWLTAAGHGCGFWDRDLGELGDRLTERCRKVEVPHLWAADGKLHAE